MFSSSCYGLIRISYYAKTCFWVDVWISAYHEICLIAFFSEEILQIRGSFSVSLSGAPQSYTKLIGRINSRRQGSGFSRTRYPNVMISLDIGKWKCH